jgi:hypothetical protein
VEKGRKNKPRTRVSRELGKLKDYKILSSVRSSKLVNRTVNEVKRV